MIESNESFANGGTRRALLRHVESTEQSVQAIPRSLWRRVVSAQKERPVIGSRGPRRGPRRTGSIDGGKGSLRARNRVQPCASVLTGVKTQHHFAAAWKIDGIDLPWLGQAVVAVVHQFIVWLGLPPIEGGEE